MVKQSVTKYTAEQDTKALYPVCM